MKHATRLKGPIRAGRAPKAVSELDAETVTRLKGIQEIRPGMPRTVLLRDAVAFYEAALHGSLSELEPVLVGKLKSGEVVQVPLRFLLPPAPTMPALLERHPVLAMGIAKRASDAEHTEAASVAG